MEDSHAPGPDAVSIIIPAHNEAGGIETMLRELIETMDQYAAATDLDWQIIVVDDGSTDDTGSAVLKVEHSRLELLKHESGRGYGAALKTGLRRAEHCWALIIDADGTYPPDSIPRLLKGCAGEEMVVGARVGKTAQIPLIRRPAKWFLTRIASYLSGVSILDLNSGLRLFPKQLADRFARILPEGFSFTSTITLAALSSGWRVRYIPIEYRKRKGFSKIRPFRDTIGFLMLIIRTIMYFDPLRVLLPVGLVFLLASVGVGLGSILITGSLMDVTTVILLVTGIHILALGMIADAINRRLP